VNLEFFIKLREMVSGGLVKMADTAKKTTAAIKGVNGTLAQSYDEIKRKINDLESTISKSTSVKHIREARRELEQLQRLATKHIGNTDSKGGGFMSGLLGPIRSLLPAMGLAGAMALGGTALNAGLDSQARQTSFEVMAGKEGGTKLNKDLTKYAQDSIYGKEVYQNAQTMLGFGLGAESVMPSMKMLGDVAMGNADKLGSLTLAFSQVKAAGKLTGQDLLQFVNAGFNPLQQMSQDTGISLGVLKEKMSDGLISFDMVEQAFKNATGAGGRFYDMTNKIAQTDFGKWQAFQGQLDGLAMQVGGVLAPVFGQLITGVLVPLTNALSESVIWIQQNAEWIQFGATVVAAATIGYYGYMFAINGVSIATKLWTAIQWGLNAAMTANPIGLIIAGIAALIAAVVFAWYKFDKFRGTILAAWEVLKGFGIMLKDYVIDKFKAIIALAGGLASALAKLFNGDFSGAWDSAKQAMSDYNASSAEAKIKAREQLVATGRSAAAAYANEVNKKKSTSVEASAATPSTGSLSSAYKGLTKGEGDDTARGVTGGGPRVININGVKFTDKIEIHNNTARESVDELQGMLEEMFLRLLNSGARLQ
jgi:tape measure domain-containing protein